MKRRNNKLEHCFRSLTVLIRSTTKCTTKPVDKKLDRLAIEFEATAFKVAFWSLFFEVPSQPCQHWRTHFIPLSSPLRISFWAWADRRANNTHALPDVRDLRTSGNCCYQSPPFHQPRDQKKRRLRGRECRKGGNTLSSRRRNAISRKTSMRWRNRIWGLQLIMPNKDHFSVPWCALVLK